MRKGELAEERSRVVAQFHDRPFDLGLPGGVQRGRAGETFHVAGVVFEPIGADRKPEVLRGNVFELMRLVDHRVGAGGNHFAEGVLPDRRIGAQEMMIDDHHVRRRGALAHARDEAVVVAGTFAAETGLRRRRHFVPERQILRQILELRAIAGVGPPRPLADDRQKHVVHRGPAVFVQLIEAMQAEIVRAPLHVGGGERHVERFAQRRDVLEVDLLLQVLGAGGDEHALPAQDGRDEIRQRLPGAGAGFRQEDAALFEHARHAVGHGRLTVARFVRRHRPGERSAGAKDVGG